MQEKAIELKAGAVVWATGWRPYDANKIQPYGYAAAPTYVTPCPNVVGCLRQER